MEEGRKTRLHCTIAYKTFHVCMNSNLEIVQKYFTKLTPYWPIPYAWFCLYHTSIWRQKSFLLSFNLDIVHLLLIGSCWHINRDPLVEIFHQTNEGDLKWGRPLSSTVEKKRAVSGVVAVMGTTLQLVNCLRIIYCTSLLKSKMI